SRKLGRPRNLRPIDEYFAVMCRLRQGLPEEHLAHLFKVSVSTVSRVFITWLNFMYLRLGQINIWPSRTAIEITMPEDFKKKYSSTRVIIDCTEVRCQMPSNLLPLGVSLNIPFFLGSSSQMPAEDVVKTQEIASLRIHVER
ncbi:unnamed protein product, partial [Porites lobata]